MESLEAEPEHHDLTTPDETSSGRQPFFVGVSNDGQCVEVSRTGERGVVVRLDGVVCEATWTSTSRVVVNGRVFVEVALAALDALRNFVANEAANPPWAWVASLIEAGLVDHKVALTERGRRVVFG